MLKDTSTIRPAHTPDMIADTSAPSWVIDWLGANVQITSRQTGSLDITDRTTDSLTFVSVVAPNVRRLDDAEFRRHVVNAYEAIREIVESSGRHLVRIWNHIPGIHDPMAGDVDRYMVFNDGRFAALGEWFGSDLSRRVPSASGVGHTGEDFVVHALAADEPGESIENPQQVPSYRYSRKYGPVPPCFSRATIVRTPKPALLISGTAAITGEQSQHNGRLQAQFELTLQHLRTLARRAHDGSSDLSRLSHVRIYFPSEADRQQIASLAAQAFAGPIEMLRADLCRTDLLVEIEAIADL